MIKILQVNKLFYPIIGGVETIVKDIIDIFDSDKEFVVDLLCCNEKRETVIDFYKSSKIIRSSSFAKILSMPISFQFFLDFIKIAPDYDIILFHYPFPLGKIASLIFKPKRVKYVVWWHSDIVRQKFFSIILAPLTRRFLKNIDSIICATEGHILHSRFLKEFREKVVIIPFAIDPYKYRIANEEQMLFFQNLKSKYGNLKKLLFVGRLVEYKGVKTLLEAIRDISGILLFIIGEGPLESEIKRFIEEKGIEDKVVLIKSLPFEKLVVYFNLCDIFILPSIYPNEAFGIVQIEAMACKKPVINTSLTSGVPYVSLHNLTGLTALPNSPVDLKDKILELVHDSNKAILYGENGFQRVENFFSINKFYDNLRNLWIKLRGNIGNT